MQADILDLLLDLLRSWKLQNSVVLFNFGGLGSAAHYPFQVANCGSYCAVMIVLL